MGSLIDIVSDKYDLEYDVSSHLALTLKVLLLYIFVHANPLTFLIHSPILESALRDPKVFFYYHQTNILVDKTEQGQLLRAVVHFTN